MIWLVFGLAFSGEVSLFWVHSNGEMAPADPSVLRVDEVPMESESVAEALRARHVVPDADAFGFIHERNTIDPSEPSQVLRLPTIDLTSNEAANFVAAGSKLRISRDLEQKRQFLTTLGEVESRWKQADDLNAAERRQVRNAIRAHAVLRQAIQYPSRPIQTADLDAANREIQLLDEVLKQPSTVRSDAALGELVRLAEARADGLRETMGPDWLEYVPFYGVDRLSTLRVAVVGEDQLPPTGLRVFYLPAGLSEHVDHAGSFAKLARPGQLEVEASLTRGARYVIWAALPNDPSDAWSDRLKVLMDEVTKTAELAILPASPAP